MYNNLAIRQTGARHYFAPCVLLVIILYTHIYTHVFTASNSSGGASGIGPSASQTSLAPKRSDIVTPNICS